MSLPPLAQLAQYVSEGRCALFVGPDLGESANGYRGLPTSWQLAEGLAELCDYRGRRLPLPQMADIFKSKIDGYKLVEYLRERLDSPEYRPLPVHELIARIPFSVIVQGGWDTLLDQALKGQQRHFQPIRRNSDLPFVHPGEQQLLLYKPYGSIDDPSSLIITENDQANINLERVIERLRGVMEQYALLFIGYAPGQDTRFVRLYDDIRQLQANYLLPAVAVQALPNDDDAAAWETRSVTALFEEPTAFLQQLAEAVAQLQGRELALPASTAPRLTPTELKEHGALLNRAMDQIGVADLVEQTNVPLLSVAQLHDIEAIHAAYERLAESFPSNQSDARAWLRKGNLEYVRENYSRAKEYYQRALAVEPDLAEIHHNLHYVELAQGHWFEALESYQKAIALQPKLAILPPRYQIEAILGSGGMGVVYRVYDTREKQQVAVKVLQRSKAQTEQILNIFKREARVLQSLNHPHIVKMLDFQPYQGHYFIVMEYLAGQSFKTVLQTTPEIFTLDYTFQLIEQVGEGLAYAHARDIIHRDIKPSNILLINNQAKLIDFGLARPLTPGEQSTLGAAITGTLTYLAPEQAMGQPTDQRADIYGLATVFYELLTTRNPSQGTYYSPSELVSGLNSFLDLVVEKARERNPTDRYPTIAAFLQELRQVVLMQAASEKASWRLQLMARLAQIANLSIQKKSLLVGLGISAGLGFLLPASVDNVIIREVGRYLGAGLAITLLLGLVARLLTATLARQSRNAIIAAYGPMLGLGLGVVNSVLWLRSFSFDNLTPEARLGYGSVADYLFLIISSVVLSLSIAVATFLVLPVISNLAKPLHKPYTTIFFCTYLLICGLLLILGLSLSFGWFGDMSAATCYPNC